MILALLLLAQSTQTQNPPPQRAQAAQQGSRAKPDAELQKELEQAIEADQKAAQSAQQQQQQTSPGPFTSLLRGAQSLNPDISVIADGDAGYVRRAPQLLSGDDPDFGPVDTQHAKGFQVQEVELAFSAIVDPYFKGEAYLTIPNLTGLEVEEAFVTTTSLPWNLQLKAGSFRSAFGRQNGQHLHVQDFTRRPLVNAAFLGSDGLRGPGAQLSWLSPLPFYLALYGEAFSLRRDPSSGAGPIPAPINSFGGNQAQRPAVLGEAKIFLPFGEEWSLFGGLNFASGQSSGITLVPGAIIGANRASELYGVDAYLKWKPLNVAQGYSSIALQAEAIVRHLGADGVLGSARDAGAYAQTVIQFARRWFLGLRGDVLFPLSDATVADPALAYARTGHTVRGSTSLTFQPSEFSRVRAYAELEKANFTGAETAATVPPSWSPGAFLQLEISIGAHGAHPY